MEPQKQMPWWQRPHEENAALMENMWSNFDKMLDTLGDLQWRLSCVQDAAKQNQIGPERRKAMECAQTMATDLENVLRDERRAYLESADRFKKKAEAWRHGADAPNPDTTEAPSVHGE